MAGYTRKEIKFIVRVLQDAYPAHKFDTENLKTLLIQFVQDNELTRIDRQLGKAADTAKNVAKGLRAQIDLHKKLQDAFDIVLSALADREIRSGLGAHLRLSLGSRLFRIRRPVPPAATDWQTFVKTLQYDLSVVSEANQKHAIYLENSNRRGPKTDTLKYGLLVQLGDIFIDTVKADCGFDDLEYGETTTFVKFLREALRPFYPLTKITGKALSNDLYRLKFGLPDTLNTSASIKS